MIRRTLGTLFRRGVWLPVLLAAAIALAGCESTDPDVPSMTGVWEGAGGGVFARLTLVESGGRISGSGFFEADSATAVTVSGGAHVHPSVTMTLSRGEGPDINYQGDFTDDDRVEGVLNGGEFQNLPLTIARVEEGED
ncbi:MAG: hypothetical protein ACREKN_01650 [Longimicrobiaceae bacterium]